MRPHHMLTGATLIVALGAATLAGCGSDESSAERTPTSDDVTAPASTTSPTTTPPTTTPPATQGAAASATHASTMPTSEDAEASGEDGDTIDGMFDVGGHELYLHCEGTGAPTVVYLHGAITDPSVDPVSNARGVQDAIADTNRFCAYDRRNVGRSDTVDAVQTPEAMLDDLSKLLDAAAIEPPYVLLGASFGGLPAYVYANTHPDEVVGMVLLDSMFPDEFSLEHLFPPQDRYEAFDAEDEQESLERLSHYDMHVLAQRFVDQEPDIPVIYLASEQEPWNEQDLGIPEYDAQILDVLAGYVDRFAPGELVWVDSPHFMEPVIPEEIADALRTVIERAATR